MGHLATEKLSSKERSEFDSRDKRIRENSQKFWDIVADAKYIRDHHLWRENWKTFEAYIEDAVGMSKAHFYRLLDADDIRSKMVVVANSEPSAMQIRKPSQLLALVGVPTEKLPSVVAAASVLAGERPMTAKLLRTAAVGVAPEIAKPKLQTQEKRSIDVEAEEKATAETSHLRVRTQDVVPAGNATPVERELPTHYSDEQKVIWLCNTLGAEKVLEIVLSQLGEKEALRTYEKLTKKTAKAKRFDQPTREQVQEFCLERESAVDPDQFFDYYESQGWKKKNGLPIKNWQSAVMNWEKSQDRKGDGPGKVDASVPKAEPARSKEQWLEDIKKRIAAEADELKDAPDIQEE